MSGERPSTTRRPDQGEATRSRLTAADLHLFNEGSLFHAQDKLGAHLAREDGRPGTRFGVWAPNAEVVSVVGAFNDWQPGQHVLQPRESSGIWEGFIPGVGRGEAYKYHVQSRYEGYRADKADPYAVYSQKPPATASIVWDLDYEWGDADWMAERASRNSLDAPISIYEMHLGSWRRMLEEGNRPLTYLELAGELPGYLNAMGFTHVEFMPVMEHPFTGSWGYQTTGYFAPTSRYGTPQDLMALIDRLHRHGIGVILDWVPSHFPTDEHGLGYFDGTHLYEHGDPRQGFHPDWTSFIFNYGRDEVRSFLISSALFWLDRYHADGLRVDAVASMLYLDYSREEGEWVPNAFGGKENLDAIAFLRRLSEVVYGEKPDVQLVAEESTAWPMVTRPVYLGGLGFGLKWDMGWMHDTLSYMAKDPVHRKHHHDQLTFRMLYAFSENYVLPLSHDEVVHGKGSLLQKMPGDEWQRFANLRVCLGYMLGSPGKKLLFMGAEFGQVREWGHDASLDWHLLSQRYHAGIQRWVADLNRLYRGSLALHTLDHDPAGFGWIDANDAEHSVATFLRRGRGPAEIALVCLNFTPVPRHGYKVGVPEGGRWEEVANSDALEYGGTGMGNLGALDATAEPHHGQPFVLRMTLPPLAAVFFQHANASGPEQSTGQVQLTGPVEPSHTAQPSGPAQSTGQVQLTGPVEAGRE